MNTDKREAAIEQLKTDLRNVLPQMLDDTDFSMVVGACEAFAQEIYADRDERIAELEKALAVYADELNWVGVNRNGIESANHDLFVPSDDGYEIARAALASEEVEND